MPPSKQHGRLRKPLSWWQEGLMITLLLISSRWDGYSSQALSFSSSNKHRPTPSSPLLPDSVDSMIRQAAVAISTAQNDTIHRQTVRLPLSESMYSTKSESFVADRAIGWQGGPQETLRFLSPLAEQLLKQVANQQQASVSTGLTVKVQSQVALDFDGSALLNAQSPLGPKQDSLALLQPNTDQYYMNLIAEMEDTFSDIPGAQAKRLFLLINPSWRNADSFGFFQSRKAQSQILDRYETTYAVDQFIMRGNKISLLKVWPHDWCVYWTPLPGPDSRPSPNPMEPQLLGSFATRPEYKDMDKLLLEALQNSQKSD